MSVRFELNSNDLRRLESTISRLPNLAEKTVNNTLHKKVGPVMVDKITPLIPVSRNGLSIRKKVHAAHSKWSKQENENLSLTIKAKGGAANKRGSFGYLVFPNEGRGKNNRTAQEFLEDGRDKAIPEAVNLIETDLIRKIEEEF